MINEHKIKIRKILAELSSERNFKHKLNFISEKNEPIRGQKMRKM
jgi:hypothetical protein